MDQGSEVLGSRFFNFGFWILDFGFIDSLRSIRFNHDSGFRGSKAWRFKGSGSFNFRFGIWDFGFIDSLRSIRFNNGSGFRGSGVRRQDWVTRTEN
ncbi:hypothetical protein D1AOALGA4SA_11594 [Olavius algarvensis Delta 1 endosymbiont]|nr:hypothetical protein D1AOALGA4SA_11594 [Olavius algarvensis Delta 1 endosymbiont]